MLARIASSKYPEQTNLCLHCLSRSFWQEFNFILTSTVNTYFFRTSTITVNMYTCIYITITVNMYTCIYITSTVNTFLCFIAGLQIHCIIQTSTSSES